LHSSINEYYKNHDIQERKTSFYEKEVKSLSWLFENKKGEVYKHEK